MDLFLTFLKVIFLTKKSAFPDQHLLATPAQEIVSTFVTSLLAPPLGERPHVEANNETEDDSDDRTVSMMKDLCVCVFSAILTF